MQKETGTKMGTKTGLETSYTMVLKVLSRTASYLADPELSQEQDQKLALFTIQVRQLS